MVAVLAAVSEEIKSRGGTESNTEYFAALVCYATALYICCSVFLLYYSYMHVSGCRDCCRQFQTKNNNLMQLFFVYLFNR